MRSLPCLLLLLLPTVALAQDKKDKPTPGDEMIYKYLCAETDKLSKKFMDGAKNIDEWKEKRPRLYREYMDMLGLWPLPEKTPLKATKTGEVEAHGVVVEKVHFQSKPGLYVTANVYRPLNEEKKKLPAIVYVCGHSGKGRDGNKTAFQDHGFWFANNGYVCIILDTLQLGEIAGIHHGTYGIRGKEPIETRFWWHSAGYTPAGVECWNGVRAIDYLITRPDVDPDKIGVTGISGGGAATFWIAAADDRVKVAVPVSGMSDLESYVKNKVINGHCDCMFLYNTYQWDWTTIAALVAPRPMLFANSDNDAIFPMDANRRIIDKLRKIYKMYGQPNLVDDYVSVGGHDYREDLRVAIFKFFNKHLKNDTTSKVEDSAKYTPTKGRELRVFPEDGDIPKDAINHKIDETFVPRAQVKLPEKGKYAEWKKQMLGKLREQCFPIPPAMYPYAITENASFTGPTKDRLLFLFEERELDAIPDPEKFALSFWKNADITFFYMVPGFVDYVTVGEVTDLKGRKWKTQVNSNLAGPRIASSRTRTSPPNYVERSFLLTGKTIDQNKLWHFLNSIQRLNKGLITLPDVKDYDWHVVGKGETGIIAAYAALFDPKIKEVVVIDPPKSHKEGPHFLGVLRVLDIPEALGLLAPTPLTIIGGKNRAFDRTEEIYRLAGAADKLVRK